METNEELEEKEKSALNEAFARVVAIRKRTRKKLCRIRGASSQTQQSLQRKSALSEQSSEERLVVAKIC